MKISVLDGSNYFKGLLLLIRKDRQVTPEEVDLMKQIGRTLGFEREFCENAIRDILENAYIEDVPPLFSTKDVALKFIRDGLHIACSDAELHPAEEDWLRVTAERNGLEAGVFAREHEIASTRKGAPGAMEADGLSVRHS